MKRLVPLLLSLLFATGAHAHLMPAQRGTLNVAGSGAYLVLSVPAAAFHGVDDDSDGRVSAAEARAHHDAIESQVRSQVRLADDDGELPLQGVMLSLAPPDDAPAAAAPHVIVLGRFGLRDGTRPLRLEIGLFGTGPAEQHYDVTVTRGAERQLARFSPAHREQRLFAAAASAFVEAAREGAAHVLGGWDHLLFLLVVLLAGGTWRSIALTLSVFMAGHAVTVAAAGLGVVRVPPAIVEPAIAATIVTLALFDAWRARRPRAAPAASRLALVFACALIHGLGLATGFLDLGLDVRHRVVALAGFNAGIELTQLAIAASVLLLVRWRRRVAVAHPVRWARWSTSSPSWSTGRSPPCRSGWPARSSRGSSSTAAARC